ncbi:response regulator transcription factor [Candidatus Chloroploca sp. M-50]|uniref:Response regulator transcription factor n=1 Tax=Candidatus Chloroploca mongolica TaxID=2528176 RepID=A0ABS4DEN8_9CHLR|nr:response regulator transcription factor [Candidatus Chloroploca mongolica]MBP1467891.1 response regulator transcription factor [Candidatus Chloroploca mongolica]
MSTATPIRILIVEDQRIVREGLRALLEDETVVFLVGEAAHGEAAVAQYEALRPDVVLMDLQMPGMDGAEATRRIRALDPQARVLVLTTYATDEFIFAALRAGAKGYLLKDASADELIAAIQAIYAGQTQLSPAVAARLVAGVGGGGPEPLTARELDVLTLIGRGQSNDAIAVALNISPRTVKVHVQNILGKLNAANRTEAVAIAVRQGVLSL